MATAPLLFWQYPVITEKTFYEQNKNDPNYLALPWATIIDKNIPLNQVYNLVKQYNPPPTYTCCQHGYRLCEPIR